MFIESLILSCIYVRLIINDYLARSMEVHYIEDDTAILDYLTDSDSDCSWLSMSSIFLDEEYSSDTSVSL